MAETEKAEKKSRAGRLLPGLAVVVLAGAAGFAVTFLELSPGALLSGGSDKTPSTAFIELEPMTVSVVSSERNRQLRVRSALEVDPAHVAEIDAMRPRISDVMITYLNSVEMEDIENPSALLALRSQMRRRIDLVLGGDRVKDLLVQEFVIN
jgi:flagellar FliL protein